MIQDKYIYYKSKNLPKHGWMQQCLNCNLITKFTILYQQDDKYKYFIYLCKPCQHKNLANIDYEFNYCKNKINN